MATVSNQGQKYTIKIEGLDHIRDMLSDNEVWQEPWQKGIEAVGVIGEQFAIRFAPMRSGLTVAKMSHRVQKKPIPLYAVVKTTAKNKRTGYGYPRLHEYSRRSPHYGWLYHAMQSSKPLWSGVLDKVTNDIENKWRND